ncbi:MAG TPA: Hsp20/alpha crystallin family protein [Natronosporangium sp.]|nr:Hsp20/alpha crystallin family protein [Natronosporangium sp.]
MTLPMLRRPQTRLLRRWDPFSELEDLYDEMSRIMERFTGDMPIVPPADIEETDDAFIIEMDVPGVKREDLTVEVRDSQLHVRGEVKEREAKGVWRRKSRPSGTFDYLVSVPGDVDPDKVEASLHEGVLDVRLGKAEHAKPRQIEIKS